jgi:acyl dehydratase
MTALDLAFKRQSPDIGRQVGVSPWIKVTQSMIDTFADVTQDHQFIHIDPDRAKAETPFGGTIAHGFLSLSMASKFANDCFSPAEGQTMEFNYGFNKVRFLTPVKTGTQIRGRFVLNRLEKRGQDGLLRELALNVEIDGSSTPALYAEWLALAVFSDAKTD